MEVIQTEGEGPGPGPRKLFAPMPMCPTWRTGPQPGRCPGPMGTSSLFRIESRCEEAPPARHRRGSTHSAGDLTVDQFNVTEVAGAPRLNQGHYTTGVSGDYSTAEREFPAGTYYVTTAQSLVPWRCPFWSPRATMAWCTGISSTGIWRPSGVRRPRSIRYSNSGLRRPW